MSLHFYWSQAGQQQLAWLSHVQAALGRDWYQYGIARIVFTIIFGIVIITDNARSAQGDHHKRYVRAELPQDVFIRRQANHTKIRTIDQQFCRTELIGDFFQYLRGITRRTLSFIAGRGVTS